MRGGATQHKTQKRKPAGRGHAKPTGAAAANAAIETSAGGIVYKRTPEGVRVAFIMDPFGKWVFAKGHLEPGESLEQAAVRETQEEMGLGGLKIIKPLGVIDFWFRERFGERNKGLIVHKFVHYYLMEAAPDAQGRPEREERIRHLIWVDIRKAMSRLSYDDVRPILRKVREYFGYPSRGGEQRRPQTGNEKGKRIAQGLRKARRRRRHRRRGTGQSAPQQSPPSGDLQL